MESGARKSLTSMQTFSTTEAFLHLLFRVRPPRRATCFHGVSSILEAGIVGTLDAWCMTICHQVAFNLPSATRSNRHEPLAGWCTVVRTNAGVLGSVSALAYPPATRPEQWFAHGSRLLILLFFFQSLRASRGNELLHTLTLGRALMPAGLPVEGRIMCHACGPRRAWLNIRFTYGGLQSSSLVVPLRCA